MRETQDVPAGAKPAMSGGIPEGVRFVARFRATETATPSQVTPDTEIRHLDYAEEREVPEGHFFEIMTSNGWSRFYAPERTRVIGPAIMTDPAPRGKHVKPSPSELLQILIISLVGLSSIFMSMVMASADELILSAFMMGFGVMVMMVVIKESRDGRRTREGIDGNPSNIEIIYPKWLPAGAAQISAAESIAPEDLRISLARR